MTEKLLTEMSYKEMEALIDHYIDRSSQQSEEMPASAFLALLKRWRGAQRKLSKLKAGLSMVALSCYNRTQ